LYSKPENSVNTFLALVWAICYILLACFDAKSASEVVLKPQKGEDLAYFLSDLHLGAYPEIEESSLPMLMDFLDHVEQRKARLYIVGDLLDFWFEYRAVVPRRPFRLLARLKGMVEKGCQVTYIAGNHDYWMGSFLTEDVGLVTVSDLLETTIDGKRFFMSHGDGIATTGGLGYRALKALLHSRIISGGFRLLHPDFGLALARLFSRVSRRRSSRNNSQPNLETFVRRKAESGFDYVILGHLHKPKIFEVGRTCCLVVGDWIDNFTYGLFAGGKLSLERWPRP
jgi:UDP-2,3-diacylglucosamine hydrolase